MDKEILVSRILLFSQRANEKPTVACINAGVGKSFVSDLKRGQLPSVAKVAALAAYLGVSTSDLVGDAKFPAELAPLADAWDTLNDEGRQRLIEYADDLVQSGKYIKSDPSGLEKEA